MLPSLLLQLPLQLLDLTLYSNKLLLKDKSFPGLGPLVALLILALFANFKNKTAEALHQVSGRRPGGNGKQEEYEDEAYYKRKLLKQRSDVSHRSTSNAVY